MKKPDENKSLVLYADDDIDDLNFVREAFLRQDNSIELKIFSCAEDLLQFIHDQKDSPLPCLVILDINMPRMAGKDALRLIRTIERYNEVPVVLFSTSTMPNDRFFADCHNAAFFTKPLNERQMDVIVKKFLDHCNNRVKK
ncbi:MAG: response regulator [Flavisolibacter sp.]|nr:response regulator [Flavisolibacter sp.]